MLFVIKKIFAVIISMFLFFSAASVGTYAPVAPDELKLSAVVLSDVHMEGNNTDRFKLFGQLLSGAYSTSVRPDVIAFAGDNTMNGQDVEWFDFYGFVNRFARDSKVLVAFGNHDFGNTDDNDIYKKLSARCIKNYNGYTGANIDKPYYSTEVNGYKFIVLSSEQNMANTVSSVSDIQIEWLRNELAAAAADGKPAFVINHNLIYGKNGIQSTWDFNLTDNNDKLYEALRDCGTHVVYFCGHAHFGVGESSVSTDGNVTYVNLPAACTDGNYYAEGNNAAAGNGCVLEVYSEKAVLRLRNFAKGVWLDGFECIDIPIV